MTKSKNFIEIEEACNHLWVDTTLIRTILGGVSKSKADNFRKELEQELDQECIQAKSITNENEKSKALANCFYYKDTHPHRLPIRRVLEKAHVDLDYVRREANKMRKAMLIENKKELSINETKVVG